jgi:hypothetical protein
MDRLSARVTVLALAAGTLVAVPIGPAHAAEIAVGARSLQSVNFPGRYVRHDNYLGQLDPVTPASTAQLKQDATFTVTPGLAGGTGCVSFQAANGAWLRHRDFRLRLETSDGTATFLGDATFCVRDGSVSGSVSLESYNYPGRFIRHRDFQLWVDTFQDTTTFRADSSFRVTAPWTPSTRRSPVVKGLYADPHLAVFGGRYYLYPTTDGYAGWSGSRFKAFSSTDLVTWQDHGTILDLGPDVSWANTRAWAPAIAAKNGKYYFYFSADTHIGVAVASSPSGPFTDPLGRPLVRAGQFSGQMIDPQVFTDQDGESYLYWGNGAAYVVRLGSDMISFDASQVRTITPSGYREAAFVFRRGGLYYFMWSENDTRDENYRVAYATGTSPVGPWTKRGLVLQKNLALGIKGTGHHSVVQVPGTDTWHIAYHRFAIPAGNGYNREVTTDRMQFNADGTIRPVVPTL